MPAEKRGSGAFRPSLWLRNPNVQSVLPSLSLRRPAVRQRCAALLAASKPVVLDCGGGVRLSGQAAAAPAREMPQLAVLLHGWEGSSDSLYILSLGQYLFERGFDVFRLNLRDHGESHHLNQGIFHSCLLPEVLGGVLELARLYPRHRRTLAGFSLGGNFALRIGASLPPGGAVISKILAVSPVLDPEQTLQALEQGNPLYRRYFIDKWRRSLIKKQQAWPGAYDFSDLPQLNDLTSMTEKLVLRHTAYPTLADYLQGYAVTGEVLRHLQVPTHILAAKDDPIIPAKDIARLHAHPLLQVTLTEHGGHCGFRERLFESSWLDHFAFQELLKD